jgi:predicted KAP-like P-loop ATPase
MNLDDFPKILRDDIELDPALDFDNYSDSIARIIMTSDPKFAVGIYGEWGTGKTTMMKTIHNKLENKKEILTVWFNAWRYEREDQFAVIALMKTIAFAMSEHDIYKQVKPIILPADK